jgi:acid phosphatase type 7
VVITGHDHNYERFAPQPPSAQADPTGVRVFVVGTGGAAVGPIGIIRPNSEVRNATTYGVLKLTRNPTSYNWEFIPIAGQTFRDSSSSPCSETIGSMSS